MRRRVKRTLPLPPFTFEFLQAISFVDNFVWNAVCNEDKQMRNLIEKLDRTEKFGFKTQSPLYRTLQLFLKNHGLFVSVWTGGVQSLSLQKWSSI